MTKPLPKEKFNQAKFATSIKNIDTETLYKMLDELVNGSAEQIAKMAIVAHELRERGEDRPILKTGVGAYLKAVYTQKLHPLAVVKLLGNFEHLSAVATVPLSVQEEILERGTVPVLTGEGVEEKELHKLKRDEIHRVFDPVNGRIVPPDEQKIVKPRGDANEPRSWPITFRLNKDEYKALEGHAERSKRSIQVLIIETLRTAKLLRTT